MGTYRRTECATRLKADRVLGAAFTQRIGRASSPMNDSHTWLSLVEELPME